MTWHSTTGGRYQVAHEDATGSIIVDFGKHEGTALDDLPATYLRWMTSRNGEDFLPHDLIQRAAALLQRREEDTLIEFETIRLPDLHDAAALIEWAEDAPAGDVAEVVAHLRDVAEQLTAALDDRAEAAVLRLLTDAGGGVPNP